MTKDKSIFHKPVQAYEIFHEKRQKQGVYQYEKKNKNDKWQVRSVSLFIFYWTLTLQTAQHNYYTDMYDPACVKGLVYSKC